MALSLEEYKTGAEKAHQLIKEIVLKTPLLRCDWLTKLTGCEVYLKMESEQVTRSFKLRGAANRLLHLQKEGIDRVVTASSGNHALACLHVASKLNMDVVIYCATCVDKSKEEKILQNSRAKLVKYGDDCCEAEFQARKAAEEQGLTYVSPYNDVQVVFGQATVALELLDQLPDLDAVFIPVGGGSLASGIIGYIKAVKPSIITVGCQPEVNCAMYEAVECGYIKEKLYSTDTFASALAGGIEKGSITFDACKQHIDKWVLVSEKEIEEAVFSLLDKEKKVVEGAAGVPLAALVKVKDEFQGKNVGLIMCGGNINTAKIAELCGKFL